MALERVTPGQRKVLQVSAQLLHGVIPFPVVHHFEKKIDPDLKMLAAAFIRYTSVGVAKQTVLSVRSSN